MKRIRLRTPARSAVPYGSNDDLHDALVAALIQAGAPATQILGQSAAPWFFAPLGRVTRLGKTCHSLVLGSPDAEVAAAIRSLRPEDVVLRGGGGFAEAELIHEPLPPEAAAGVLACLMLSPLAVTRRDQGKHWHERIDDPALDLSAAINHRLGRLLGRPTELRVEPDHFYLRACPDHAVRVPVKIRNGKTSFVIGMSVPLVLEGPPADLAAAWYAGIGEKNRMGFGAIGAVERGLGR